MDLLHRFQGCNGLGCRTLAKSSGLQRRLLVLLSVSSPVGEVAGTHAKRLRIVVVVVVVVVVIFCLIILSVILLMSLTIVIVFGIVAFASGLAILEFACYLMTVVSMVCLVAVKSIGATLFHGLHTIMRCFVMRDSRTGDGRLYVDYPGIRSLAVLSEP